MEVKFFFCIIVEKFVFFWLIFKICGCCDGLVLKKFFWGVEDKVKFVDWILDCVVCFFVIVWVFDEEIEGEFKEVVVVLCGVERKVLWKGIKGMFFVEECEVLLCIMCKVEEEIWLENFFV